jgi:hypothetical protein
VPRRRGGGPEVIDRVLGDRVRDAERDGVFAIEPFEEARPYQIPSPPDLPAPRDVAHVGGRHATFEERRTYVEQLWRALYSDTEILAICCKRFAREPSTIKRDLREIREAYTKAETSPEIIASRKARMRSAMEAFYQHAMASGDRTAARFMLDRLARLDGLYAPIKLETAQTITHVNMQINVIVEALDEEGLRAWEIVMEQLQRAGVANSLAAPSSGTDDVIDAESTDVYTDDEPDHAEDQET